MNRKLVENYISYQLASPILKKVIFQQKFTKKTNPKSISDYGLQPFSACIALLTFRSLKFHFLRASTTQYGYLNYEVYNEN